MKIGVLTTWGGACGIATYSEELYTALLDLRTGFSVVALAPAEGDTALSRQPGGIPFELCWQREADGIAEHVIPRALKLGCDVLHIQHEFGLFKRPSAFRDLLRMAKDSKLKTVVTLHTVSPYPQRHPGFFESIRKLADVIVVHTPQAYATLRSLWGPAPVMKIHHGTPWPQMPGNKERGQDVLRIPFKLRDRSVVWALALGFIGPNKNLECTINAFVKLRATSRARNVGLIICGMSNDFYGEAAIPARIYDSSYDQMILYRPMFVKVEEMADVMAAVDFGILNELHSTFSASGQVHLFCAHGVPLAVADVPKHIDAIQAGALPFQLNPSDLHLPTDDMVDVLAALARDPELREEVKIAQLRFAKETAWNVVAQQYAEIYTKLLSK